MEPTFRSLAQWNVQELLKLAAELNAALERERMPAAIHDRLSRLIRVNSSALTDNEVDNLRLVY